MMNFKKLRKIYRILFPLQISEVMLEQKRFKNKLDKNPKILKLEEKDKHYIAKTSHGLNINIRSVEHSDYEVFEQIFNFEEFEIIRKLIALNFDNNKNISIIDAGANVGYTTLYFKHYFKDAQVFSIEPSHENAKFFKRNVFDLNTTLNVKFYESALSHKAGMKYSISRNFRDSKDWSITTESDKDGNIYGITINEIIEENNLETITLLKIDIEGAERFIFEDKKQVSFLKKTKIIALEIHDEYKVRESIYNILIENNFYLLESGELTIGINKNYL